MNTVKSFWLGWGALCAAGGGAYVFAKQQINADRQAKMEAMRKKQSMIKSLEASEFPDGRPAHTDTVGSPSQEASLDPAPTRHAPSTESEQVVEKSKYESATPYRARTGNRLS